MMQRSMWLQTLTPELRRLCIAEIVAGWASRVQHCNSIGNRIGPGSNASSGEAAEIAHALRLLICGLNLPAHYLLIWQFLQRRLPPKGLGDRLLAWQMVLLYQILFLVIFCLSLSFGLAGALQRGWYWWSNSNCFNKPV